MIPQSDIPPDGAQPNPYASPAAKSEEASHPDKQEGKSSLAGDAAQVARGLLMGGADIIPGVSGGTVALILGIYERLVTAVSHFDLVFLGHVKRGEWAKAAGHVDLRFLVALGGGIAAGILGLGTVMNHLLENQLVLTLAVFFGLIVASSVVVARSIERWDALKIVLAVAGAAFAYWLVAQPFMQGLEGYPYLFLCGMVAICAMILPGISGAFILLIMGKYEFVTDKIRDVAHGEITLETVLVIAVFGCGCAVGLLAFSKFLRWLLARYHGQTLAILCGFMIGSLRRIWPFKGIEPGIEPDIKHSQYPNILPSEWSNQVLFALLLAIAAFALVIFLDWITRRHAGPES